MGDDQIFDLDRVDLRVLLLYGRTMLSAQMLEFSVFQLAQIERGPAKDMELDLRRIEGLLKHLIGSQTRAHGPVLRCVGNDASR